jgi:hypothetical protein
MASAATQFGVVSAAISMAFGTAEAVRRIIKVFSIQWSDVVAS